MSPPIGVGIGLSASLLAGVALPAWVPNPQNTPDLALNFTNNRAWNKATKAQPSAASLLTVSRASSGTVNDSLGNWTQVASNLPRLSDLGLLVEEARTNAIRNNSMAGAVVMADGVGLLTNGTFTPAGGAGWNTTITGTGAIDFSTPGVVKITGDGGTLTTYIWQQLNNLIPGRSYVVSVGASTASILVSVGATQGAQNILGRSQVNGNATNNPTPDRVAFTAPANGTVFVNFERSTASQGSLFPVSVQDGERVENGGFTSNPLNAAQSTVQNGWQWSINTGTGAVTWSGGTNQVSITGDGTHNSQLSSAAIPTVAGFTYTISLDVGGNGLSVIAGTAAFGGTTLANVAVAPGTGRKVQFTATTSTSFVLLQLATAATASVTNVSVQSAGAFPTNWTLPTLNLNGLVLSVVGTGTESGINYIDYRFNGTATATTLESLVTDSTSGIAATYGQTWTSSVFAYLAAGSAANLTALRLAGTPRTSGGGGGIGSNTTTISATAGPLGNNRLSSNITPLNSTTGAMTTAVEFTPTSGQPIDATIRIGWPQLENNSLINSTVASAATAASGASGVNGSAVYSVGGGTGTAATLNVTWTAGVMTVNSVASAGSYTVFPPSPAALTYVSGTATGWTGATVTLTPTNNAANAFATSPIVTTSSAATRAADVVSLTSPPAFGSAYSLFAQATPQAPASWVANQEILCLSDGSVTNIIRMFRQIGTGNPITNFAGGTGGGFNVSGNLAQNSQSKFAFALASGSQSASANGGTVGTGSAATLPPGVNQINFGAQPNGVLQMNGFLSQAAIWASQAVPGAQLQSMTQ